MSDAANVSRAPAPPGEVFGWLDANLEGVATMLAAMPSAFAVAMVERNRDFANHHKRKTLSRLNFDSGDRGVRMIASRFFGYGQTADVRQTGKIEDAQGESFIAGRPPGSPGFLTPEAIRSFEEGGTVAGDEWMAIPFGPGLPFRGVFRNRPVWRGKDGRNVFKGEDGSDRFVFVYSELAQRVLIFDRRPQTLKKLGDNAYAIVGILAPRRKQRKRMDALGSAEMIRPAHEAKAARAVELAATAAGVAALKAENAWLSAKRSAWKDAFAKYLDANPRKFGAARMAASRAAAAVKRDGFKGGKA